MILFELYRQLDVRMYQTLAQLDPTYGPCAKYLFEDDTLLLLGSDHSIRLNMATKEAIIDNPIRNWDIANEPVLWFSEDSYEGYIVRAINNVFRQWLNVDPFDSEEKLKESIIVINENLTKYGLRIFYDSTGMCIYHNDKIITFEQSIELIGEMDLKREQSADLQQILKQAQELKIQGRLADAVPYYEQIIRNTSRPDFIYTVAAFELAECYYFIGNYDRAVSLYYRCNLEFIANENDFNIHLGHALLDCKMKKYEREIKVYYRSKVDPNYILTHKDAVEAAKREVAPVFEEYEQTCLEMGQKKYAEHRNHLPVGADDIDDLMALDGEENSDNTQKIKVYEGIRLTEPSVQKNVKRKSDNELFYDALDLFIAGDYQKAFDIYWMLTKELPVDSDYYTWAQFQLGKLYTIFDEHNKALSALLQCDPNRFGIVYRQEDFLVLLQHVKIVCNDFEDDIRYRKLIRGRFDFYFAQYDPEYNQMLRDHKLIRKFVQYEKECKEDSIEEFGANLVLDEGDSSQKKKWGFFGKKKKSKYTEI